MSPFVYPARARERSHAPRGYVSVHGYRDWLRDEFEFRCVYCLLRECWVPGGFHLDHFKPVSVLPESGLNYENLLYACATCNAAKADQLIPDPTRELLRDAISVDADGLLHPWTEQAQRLVRQLGLNRPRYCQFRQTWIGIVSLIKRLDSELQRAVLGYPDDLPDLSVRRPPEGNERSAGIAESHFERRRLGTLPATY